MPVYNGARYLPEAIASLRAQTRDGWDLEVIATDDGSTDESRQILEEAAKTLPLTVIDGAKSGNWVASVNKAFRIATGDWVGMLHQDDAFAPRRLSALAEAISAHPEADMAANATRFINSRSRRAGEWSFPLRRGCGATLMPPSDSLPRLLVQNNFAVPGVMFRRALLEELGYFDESLRYAADWDFWLRVASRKNIIWLPECLSDFRVHGGSQTIGFAGKQAEYSLNLREALARHSPADTGTPAAAELSIAVNEWLASRMTEKKEPLRFLLRAFCKAGAGGSVRYLRWSRIVSRITARLRAGLGQRQG